MENSRSPAMDGVQLAGVKDGDNPSMFVAPGVDWRVGSGQVCGTAEPPVFHSPCPVAAITADAQNTSKSKSKSKSITNKNKKPVAIGGSKNEIGAAPQPPVSQPRHWQHLYELTGRKTSGGMGNGNGNGVASELGIQRPIQDFNLHAPETMSDIRTKRIPSAGQFLGSNSSKGKGVVGKNITEHPDIGQSNGKAVVVAAAAETPLPLDLGLKLSQPCLPSVGVGTSVLLREWLRPGRKVDRNESLHIFRQIVELVDVAHSRQVALRFVRPSCFKLLPCNQVKYVGCSAETVMPMDGSSMASRKRSLTEGLPRPSAKQQKLMKNTNTAVSQHLLNSENRMQHAFDMSVASNTSLIQSEDKWYTSPEGISRNEHTYWSDIYSLGVLLFELFSSFESWEVHAAAMLNIRHRILPPNFLSEYPKEAGFCLWLLHPEPSLRPLTRDILHSELFREYQIVFDGQLSLPDDEDLMGSELLLGFLLASKENKDKRASKLVKEIGEIDADIEEIKKRYLLRTTGTLSREPQDIPKTEDPLREVKFMKDMTTLESAYFSSRSQIRPVIDETSRSDNYLLKGLENEANQKPTDPLGGFYNGLCKYARYNKFEVRGTLRNGGLFNNANVICSLSFDSDEEYFAAAGISKKIKIYEFNRLLNDAVDVHYPAVEMISKSKLSCVSWNSYIKNYLAATDYDGVVQLWDASVGEEFSRYIDHQKRAWSVHFSPVDPTKFASGSDDCSVKQWSINQEKCTSTIRSPANVCCVQFSAYSSHLLAFGTADYKTYCYDIRYTRHPWCTLAGHGKAVSYVKFLDTETIVTASTDNTLKLWDLNKTSSNGLSPNACSLTYRGHSNEKNFVGLSVSDGYIACGSESNEVYAYHRSLPMPITSHKFGSIDPVTEQETDDDNMQFVSSVCWKEKSDMVIAANSSGTIKVLQIT